MSDSKVNSSSKKANMAIIKRSEQISVNDLLREVRKNKQIASNIATRLEFLNKRLNIFQNVKHGNA